MIKNMAAVFNASLPALQKALDQCMYNKIQVFMKGNVTSYYASASKKKKANATLLKYVRDMGMDGTVDDDAAQKGVLQTDSISNRPDPFSPSQLHFMRTILDFQFNEKSKGMKGGLIKEKTFKDSQLSKMVQVKLFVDDYIANHKARWRHRYRTLYELKSRVIYDEIEAEVNLCFDQFMFKLGQHIFVHYKRKGSLNALPADLKVELDAFHRNEALYSTSYEFILKQTDFELLGRSINVSKILAQIVNQYLRRCIDVAITRFEASDILSIS
eukprot:jgi/Hompol1/2875/HPOL_006205-RA